MNRSTNRTQMDAAWEVEVASLPAYKEMREPYASLVRAAFERGYLARPGGPEGRAVEQIDQMAMDMATAEMEAERNAALEEAALVCDALASTKAYNVNEGLACESCADRIRALKNAAPGNGGENFNATASQEAPARERCPVAAPNGYLDAMLTGYHSVQVVFDSAQGAKDHLAALKNAAPQASPSVAPADSESGSAVGPAGAAPQPEAGAGSLLAKLPEANELAAAMRDAARYRWLRRNDTSFAVVPNYSAEMLSLHLPADKALDAAIDAAMSSATEGRSG